MADITGFIQAKNYRKGGNLPVNRLVIHSMEHPEIPGTAKAVCQWFAGKTAPQASAHFNIDDKEIWGSVHEEDTAWHAPPNQHSIGIEHAGFAAQTVAEWSDPYSEAMLRLSARLAAGICARHGLPVAFVPAAGLLRGERGITTHAEVSKAWRQTDHSDPGPNFPMAHYLNLVREAAAPKEVKAMYDPPLGPIAAVWQEQGTGKVFAAISPAGDIYGWAPGPGNSRAWYGNVDGKPYWGTRKAALIGARDDGREGIMVTATDGAVYRLPDGIDQLG